jgi:hypothetical protein
MKEFVCVECAKDRAKGCTLIVEDGNRLPLVCVDARTKRAILTGFMEVPDTKTMDFSY